VRGFFRKFARRGFPSPGLLRNPTSSRKRGEVNRTRAPIQLNAIMLKLVLQRLIVVAVAIALRRGDVAILEIVVLDRW
jgi:hypothetical protein